MQESVQRGGAVTRLPACFGVESWHALAGTPHPKRIIVSFHAHHSSLRAWRSLYPALTAGGWYARRRWLG